MIISIQKNKPIFKWAYIVFGCLSSPVIISSVAMHMKTGADVYSAFPSQIAAHVYHPTSSQGHKVKMASWFIGAADVLEGDCAAYSLAFANPGLAELSPVLTDTTLIVNNLPDQINPLRGKRIAHMALLGINPLVVTADNLSELILLNIAVEPHRLLTMSLKAVDNSPFAIMDIATLQNLSRAADSVVVNPNMTAAVAFRPAAGVFGDAGSGIAMIITAVMRTQQEAEKQPEGFKPEEIVMGILESLPLDRQSPFIGLSNPLSAMKNFVTLHASELLHKIFVGVNVATGHSINDGAMAVMVAHITPPSEGKVTAVLEPLTTTTAVGEDIIIAARSCGEPVTVAVHHVRTMRTSTSLDYLIVNGGVGPEDDTACSVYALPLLRDTGMLAHAYEPPVTTYYGKVPTSRSFVVPPTTPQDLYTSTSVPARVGNGPVHARIMDVVVAGDAVFVATADSADGCAPGMWHSQAIFGPLGTVIAWTPWRRAGGAHMAAPLKKIAFDEHAGTWWAIVQQAPYVRMTAWSTDSSLAVAIKKNMSAQGPLYNVSESVRGILPQLLLVTGYQKIVIAQVDEIVERVLCPRTDFSNGYVCSDGSLRNFAPEQPCSWLSMTGGDLLNMGALVTALVIPRAHDAVIVAGGSGGIAALITEQGNGCKAGEDFSGMTTDLAWRTLDITVEGHPLKDVRKICMDQGHVYILTLTHLVRISIDSLAAPECAIKAHVLASLEALGGFKHSTCADLFVAGPLACLATSIGCFRTGSGVDVATIHGAQEAQWTKINLPYSPGPVVCFAPIGPVPHAHNRGYDTNIYVLSAAATSAQSRIYRLSIVCDDVVTDETVRLLPDEVVQGASSFFLSLGDYRHKLITDGALLGLTRNCSGKNPAYVEFLSPYWQIWPLGLTASLNVVRGAYRGAIAEQVSYINISSMMYSSGVGSWLMLTDIGLIHNE